MPLLRVYLGMRGDFDPQEFTAAVGLPPDRTERRGERDATRVIPRCDSWIIWVPERHGYEVEVLVAELLARLEGYESRIAAARVWGLTVALKVVAFWDPDESSSPAVSLSPEQIVRLSRLGALLDVDLIPCASEKPEDSP